MSADVDLERKLRDLLAVRLGGQQGQYPRWGDSPRTAAEIAHDTSPRHWGIPRTKRGLAVSAFALAVVGVVGASSIHALLPGGGSFGSDNVTIWAVAALDENRVVAVGGTEDDEGSLVVARSMDGGKTWQILHPGAPALTTVAVAGTRLFGATRCTAILDETESTRFGPTPTSCLYASEDGGASWRDLKAGRLVDPSFSDAEHGWARSPIDLDDAQSIFYTADGGRSWSSLPSPCSAPTPLLRHVAAAGPDLAYVLCIGNIGSLYLPDYAWQVMRVQRGSEPAILFTSPNGGPDDPPATCLTVRADGSGLLCVANALYLTADGARTWLPAEGGPDIARGNVQSPVFIGSTGLGFAAVREIGVFTAIEGTRDGGRTWHRLAAWDYWSSQPFPTDASETP